MKLIAFIVLAVIIAFSSSAFAASDVVRTASDEVGPGAKVRFLIDDFDLNISPSRTDRFDGDDTGDKWVVFRTDRSDAGKASPDIKETGPSTGLFEFEIQLVPIEGGEDGEPVDVRGGSNPRIGVLPGDLLIVSYEDNRNPEGKKSLESKIVAVKSWDPEFEQDKESYKSGDRILITITDKDANLSEDTVDSLSDIRVFSESDPAGQRYSALETEDNSGVFELSFSVSESRSGSVFAKDGEEITIIYEDKFPADYAIRSRQINNPEKEFTYTIIIGEQGVSAVTQSAPVLKDTKGADVPEAMVDQQVILSTEINNNRSIALPFVAFVEVRNSDGQTVFLQWHTGTLNASSVTGVGLSWTPDAAGNYTVRVFVVDDIANPSIISPVSESQITVLKNI
ncbi:MAG: hypothetical protein DA330_07975 [Nitrososphaera sp.]|nr:hypothetical protein [Nitrososphaera sp.]